jgi:hypothetical protein
LIHFGHQYINLIFLQPVLPTAIPAPARHLRPALSAVTQTTSMLAYVSINAKPDTLLIRIPLANLSLGASVQVCLLTTAFDFSYEKYS